MTREPSTRQLEAIDAYVDLQRTRPDLFAPRKRRALVLDRATLLDFATTKGVVVGVLATTPYLWLLNDLVRTRQPDGSDVTHTYLREIAPPDDEDAHGVVVLPTGTADDGTRFVVMVEQERHATGTVELELPRGFGVPGTDSQTQALRELLEETGFSSGAVTPLGTTLTNSGAADELVDYFKVEVGLRGDAAPEPGEAGITVRLIGWDDLWSAVASGAVRDGFTAQALCLDEAHRRSLGARHH